MPNSSMDRRRFIHCVVVAGAAAPLAGLIAGRAAAEELSRLDERAPQAVALGYVHDTADVDQTRFPQHTIEQRCDNCNLIQGPDGDEWRPCAIFPGKLVAAAGWCAAWVRKPGT